MKGRPRSHGRGPIRSIPGLSKVRQRVERRPSDQARRARIDAIRSELIKGETSGAPEPFDGDAGIMPSPPLP